MVKRVLAGVAIATGLAMTADAQCVMCFRTAQAQQSARAQVLNAGIVVLGLPPLAILAGLVVLAVKRDRE